MDNEDTADAGIHDGEPRTAPLFVVPGAGATTSQGMGSGAGTSTGSPVIPPVYVTDSIPGGGPGGNLATRVEATLAEDGRFLAQLPGLVISADDKTGHVTLGGTLDDPFLRSSLIATVHAVSGVTDVTDALLV